MKSISKKSIILFFVALVAGFSIGMGLNVDFPDIQEAEMETGDLIETETETETETEDQQIEEEGDEIDYYQPEITHEERIVETVENEIKGVVSVEMRERDIGGSGFFISSDGYILTNRHVVSQTGSYYVVTHDGEELDAELVSEDPIRDIAFLKVEGEDFHVSELGDSDGLRLGQTSIAIGYVLGELKNSVSVGVVSGLVRDIWAREGWRYERLEGMIQTDAAINLGNSGGPLLNLKGEVIGINTAKDVQADNVGFAIPINQAKKSIQSVLEHGKVISPYLGVRYMMIDEQEQRMRNLPIDYGALIVRGGPGSPAVDPGTPAQEAGLREGDIITRMDGVKIDSENPLWEVIMNYMPGDSVEIEYMRGDETHTVEIVLDEREN